MTCFHSLWEFVGGVYSPDLFHLGGLTFRPFLKPLDLSQAGKGGIHKGTGCGRRLKKGCLLATEGEAVIEPALQEKDAVAWLKGILEVLT